MSGSRQSCLQKLSGIDEAILPCQQCNLLAFVPNIETEIIQIPKFLLTALTESNLSAPISSIIDFVPETNPATRNRTRDHLIAAALYSQMLYQLSYSRLAVCDAARRGTGHGQVWVAVMGQVPLPGVPSHTAV